MNLIVSYNLEIWFKPSINMASPSVLKLLDGTLACHLALLPLPEMAVLLNDYEMLS